MFYFFIIEKGEIQTLFFRQEDYTPVNETNTRVLMIVSYILIYCLKLRIGLNI